MGRRSAANTLLEATMLPPFKPVYLVPILIGAALVIVVSALFPGPLTL